MLQNGQVLLAHTTQGIGYVKCSVLAFGAKGNSLTKLYHVTYH